MKCTCPTRPNMVKKSDGNHNFWWVCPVCGKTIGKKEETEKTKEEQ